MIPRLLILTVVILISGVSSAPLPWETGLAAIKTALDNAKETSDKFCKEMKPLKNKESRKKIIEKLGKDDQLILDTVKASNSDNFGQNMKDKALTFGYLGKSKWSWPFWVMAVCIPCWIFCCICCCCRQYTNIRPCHKILYSALIVLPAIAATVCALIALKEYKAVHETYTDLMCTGAEARKQFMEGHKLDSVDDAFCGFEKIHKQIQHAHNLAERKITGDSNIVDKIQQATDALRKAYKGTAQSGWKDVEDCGTDVNNTMRGNLAGYFGNGGAADQVRFGVKAYDNIDSQLQNFKDMGEKVETARVKVDDMLKMFSHDGELENADKYIKGGLSGRTGIIVLVAVLGGLTLFVIALVASFAFCPGTENDDFDEDVEAELELSDRKHAHDNEKEDATMDASVFEEEWMDDAIAAKPCCVRCMACANWIIWFLMAFLLLILGGVLSRLSPPLSGACKELPDMTFAEFEEVIKGFFDLVESNGDDIASNVVEHCVFTNGGDHDLAKIIKSNYKAKGSASGKDEPLDTIVVKLREELDPGKDADWINTLRKTKSWRKDPNTKNEFDQALQKCGVNSAQKEKIRSSTDVCADIIDSLVGELRAEIDNFDKEIVKKLKCKFIRNTYDQIIETACYKGVYTLATLSVLFLTTAGLSLMVVLCVFLLWRLSASYSTWFR